MASLIERVRENIDSAGSQIAEAVIASGRHPEDVSIMAVTKTHPVEYIKAALDCGVIHIGENRISEGGRKIRHLGESNAVFHAIGVLHRKEVRQATRDFQWLDAVHKIEIIEEIARRNASPTILLEVNTSGETAKKGFLPDVELLEDVLGRVLELKLPLKGFLTVGPLSGDKMKQRRSFATLREIRDSLESRLAVSLPVLSMGMSDDFVLAVEEGSTMVRLGRRLFGERTELV